MAATASVRDLRNRFPQVRKLLEAEGSVLLTERGRAKYRLTPYTEPTTQSPQPVDYWARLTSYQPTPLSPRAAQALQDDNRGNR